MESYASCILLNGLLSFVLGLVVLLAVFRVLGKREWILPQLGVFILALAAVNLGNTYWWHFSLLRLPGVVPWLAMIMFWTGLVYFYLIHFETIVRDGGPSYMLFRYIDESPGGTRSRDEILKYFRDQTVLSDRINALIASGWLIQTTSGCYVVAGRGRLVLAVVNSWSGLLGYPWGG